VTNNFQSLETSKEKIYKVSEINRVVKNLLQEKIPKLWINGEVSNFIQASSGHWYFTLKDKQAEIRCTFFKGQNQFSKIQPKNGDLIEAFGNVSIYEARGTYQINLEQIREIGTGSLYEQFIKLKNKLEKKGFFEDSKKLTIPLYPKKIGIITSSTGAALRDVLSVFAKASNYHELTIFPSLVQGLDAAHQLSNAIKIANNDYDLDLIIICRGGGSIEDLWPFNEEALVYALAESEIPIISGVGHETDFTLCDFVSDIRAPTPTAAATMATEKTSQIDDYLNHYSQTIQKIMRTIFLNNSQKIDFLEKRLTSPQEKLMFYKDHLLKLIKDLTYQVNQKIIFSNREVEFLNKRISLPSEKINQAKYELNFLNQSLMNKVVISLDSKKQILKLIQEKINILNPKNIMAKGYSIVYNKNIILKDSNNLKQGDLLKIRLHSGEISAQTKDVKKN
jgi:exodeoxyribonuclease VII large subunit